MATVERIEVDMSELMTAREVAELVGVRPVTIRAWRHRGYITPRAMGEHGGRFWYDVEEVVACARDRLRSAERRMAP